MAKRKKYNSFTFYTNHNVMRVVLLSIFAGVVGVVIGSVALLLL